jgi:hypothetical protein
MGNKITDAAKQTRKNGAGLVPAKHGDIAYPRW